MADCVSSGDSVEYGQAGREAPRARERGASGAARRISELVTRDAQITGSGDCRVLSEGLTDRDRSVDLGLGLPEVPVDGLSLYADDPIGA